MRDGALTIENPNLLVYTELALHKGLCSTTLQNLDDHETTRESVKLRIDV